MIHGLARSAVGTPRRGVRRSLEGCGTRTPRRCVPTRDLNAREFAEAGLTECRLIRVTRYSGQSKNLKFDRAPVKVEIEIHGESLA